MDIIFKLDEIDNTAKTMLASVSASRVFALHGEMGAGKTTFVHALCNELGVTDTVGSPTFSIINQYQGKDAITIFHIDMYRLKDEEEAIQAGVEDALYSGHYCFVEWPDRAPGILPDDCIHLSIVLLNNDTRKLTIKL